MSLFKDVVVCKYSGCNQIYNDPRILPCGHRTCAAHIDQMIVKRYDIKSGDREMIKCHFCEEIHSFPENSTSFPVDRNIPLLINLKYCNEHEKAKKSFNEMTQLLANLFKFNEEDYVIDYFERVEADIRIDKEANMRKLTAHYQKLENKVHERKCCDATRRGLHSVKLVQLILHNHTHFTHIPLTPCLPLCALTTPLYIHLYALQHSFNNHSFIFHSSSLL